nr:hypothetical protein [Stappia indica]
MLANFGPGRAGPAIEELEETARLALLTRGLSLRQLTPDAIDRVVRTFDVEWT